MQPVEPANPSPNICAAADSLRSPLGRKPFGNSSNLRVAVAVVVSVLGLLAGCTTSRPQQFASLAVLATDADGSPIAGITISVTRVGGSAKSEATTDQTGHAHFSGLEPGRWLVDGPSFGTEPTRPVSVSLADGATAKARLVVSTEIIDTVEVQGQR